eukprot:COSAG02_NODE_4941_length_4807_cov_1.502124_5_plen_110_part_00
MLGITRRGLVREMTNLNIDTELDGPSEHVRHIQYHKDLVEPAVRGFLQRCLEDSAGVSTILMPVPVTGGLADPLRLTHCAHLLDAQCCGMPCCSVRFNPSSLIVQMARL